MRPFFFLLEDSDLGSGFSALAAVCSELVFAAAVLAVPLAVPLPVAGGFAAPEELPFTEPPDVITAVASGVAAAGAASVAAVAGVSGSATGAAVSDDGVVPRFIGAGRLPLSGTAAGASVAGADPVLAGVADESPVDSDEPAGTVSTAIEFPDPPPAPTEPGVLLPGLSTSVADSDSAGGCKFGCPLCAAVEKSGPL